MRIFTLFLLLTLTASVLTSQVSINTTNAPPDPSAMLDISSSDKGLLIPRLLEVQRVGISAPALGLLVFQTDGVSGFYYYFGNEWLHLTEGVINMSNNNIPKWDGQKLTNSELFESGGNIGIGTTNPTQKLDVDGQIRIQGGDPEQGKVLTSANDGTGTWKTIGNEHINAGNGLEWNGDTLNSVWTQSGNNIFYNNTGNMGIGTNNPDALLTLSNTATVLKLHNPDTIGRLAIEFARGNTLFGMDSLTDWRIGNIDNTLLFTSAQDSTEKKIIVITHNNRVGIGIEEPTSTLDVDGKIRGKAICAYRRLTATASTTATNGVYLNDLSIQMLLQKGDIVKVDLACNIWNSGDSHTHMMIASPGETGIWLQTPNWISNRGVNRSGGYSTGIFKSNTNGQVTFVPSWHVSSLTGYAVYCNINAHIIGKE